MPEILRPNPRGLLVTCHFCTLLTVKPTAVMGFEHAEGDRMLHVCPDCIKSMAGGNLVRCKKCHGIHYVQGADPILWHQYPGAEKYCGACRPAYLKGKQPKPVEYCAVCGDLFGKQQEDQKVCNTCAQNYEPCHQCGRNWIDKAGYDYMFMTGGGLKLKKVKRVHLCEPCMSELPHRCRICGCYAETDAEWDNEKNACIACAPNLRVCNKCGSGGHKDKGTTLADGRWVCRQCSGELNQCNKCGQYAFGCGAKYHKHHDKYSYCPACIGSPIMGHNFKREPVFYGEGPLFYGWENEFEFHEEEYRKETDKLRKWAAERGDLMHLVHDGSLKYGVELVSMPASLAWWADQPEIAVFPAINNRIEYGTAGCHIHMSRAAFQVMHLHKFMEFINDNFDNFIPIFKRGIGHYCQECPIDLSFYAENGENAQPNRDNKYWYINMRSKHTVEMRVFRSAQSWPELLGYIQLLDSVYHYTKDIAPKDMVWREYYRFITRAPEYFILADQLEKNPRVPADCPRKAEELAVIYGDGRNRKPVRFGWNMDGIFQVNEIQRAMFEQVQPYIPVPEPDEDVPDEF